MKKILTIIAITILFSAPGYAKSKPEVLPPPSIEKFTNAVRECNITEIQTQIDRKIDINRKDERGVTALMLTAFWECPKITQLLIDNGADVNLSDNQGWTALTRAASSGYLDITTILVDNNANINAATKGDRFTILMLTVSNEHVAIVKYLLSKKVKVNTRDKDGWRALRLANNRTIRHLLKKAGAK